MDGGGLRVKLEELLILGDCALQVSGFLLKAVNLVALPFELANAWRIPKLGD